MNYYNPYFITNTPIQPRLTNFFRQINLKSILNGTQKTLNIINQAIPIIKEGAPMLKNAKTMFKIMNEFKKIDAPKKITKETNKKNNTIIKKETGPKFFI